MEIQNEAVNIIELIAQRVNPLFKGSNVRIKRESDPSIFAEHLRYEKGTIQFKITACLHPHDYPYTLAIQLVDKTRSPWRYINQQELLDMAKTLCGVHETQLLIATDTQVESTVKELCEIVKCILNNTFRNK